MKTQKGSVSIIVLVILLVAGGGYLYINRTSNDVKEVPQSDTLEVTEQKTTSTTNREEMSPAIRTFRVLENTKTYTNNKYNYSVDYPENFTALEPLGFMKGYAVADGDNEDRVMIVETKSNFDPENIPTGYEIVLGQQQFNISRENGSAFIDGSETVQDFWSKLGGTEPGGVNQYIETRTIAETDFIIFTQKNQEVLTLQALFMHKDNFFWVGSSYDPSLLENFLSILETFKLY